MEFNNKFNLGQTVYYFETDEKGAVRLKSEVEAILIENNVLGHPQFFYLVDKNHWKQERELFESEKELD